MDDQDQAADVVLSAEHASVTTAWVPREHVRIRREVITEEMTVTVTVRREVLRIQHQALGMGSGAGRDIGTEAPGAPTGPEVLEVLLSAERPVVSLEVVPYELVRLGVRSVATATPVTVELSREVVEVTTASPDTP